jgi:hypothetical protein
VGSDRGFAYVEFVRDLLHGEAVAETLKDRDLAGREIGGIAGFGVFFEFASYALDTIIYDMG